MKYFSENNFSAIDITQLQLEEKFIDDYQKAVSINVTLDS